MSNNSAALASALLDIEKHIEWGAKPSGSCPDSYELIRLGLGDVRQHLISGKDISREAFASIVIDRVEGVIHA